VNDCNIVQWSPLGDELFGFCDGEMLAIPVQTEPTLSVGEPQALFSVDSVFFRAYNDFAAWFFDVSPDGERFLMAAEREPESEIVVVLNWLDEVDRLTSTP
jgi:hypothetical protein